MQIQLVNLKQALIIFLLFWLSFPIFANASVDDRYAPIYVNTENPSSFLLLGIIDSRTSLNFDRAIDQYGIPRTFVLASGGGLVHIALSIARDVNRYGMNTVIPEDASCVSSCSFIFLAGKRKLAEGELGIHQISSTASDVESSQIAISDIIDVLSKFETPQDLIVNMLRTPSDQMYILSPEEKSKYNYYGYLNKDNFNIQPKKDNTFFDNALEEDSFNFLLEYHEIFSQNNVSMLANIGNFYAQKVMYYGKEYTHLEIMEDKKKFSIRWPIRDYSLDPATADIFCYRKTCRIQSQIDFYARNDQRKDKSRGISQVDVTILFTNQGPKIINENSKVIHRYEKPKK